MLFFEIEENSPTLLLLQLDRSRRFRRYELSKYYVDTFREIRPDHSSCNYSIKNAAGNLVK